MASAGPALTFSPGNAASTAANVAAAGGPAPLNALPPLQLDPRNGYMYFVEVGADLSEDLPSGTPTTGGLQFGAGATSINQKIAAPRYTVDLSSIKRRLGFDKAERFGVFRVALESALVIRDTALKVDPATPGQALNPNQFSTPEPIYVLCPELTKQTGARFFCRLGDSTLTEAISQSAYATIFNELPDTFTFQFPCVLDILPDNDTPYYANSPRIANTSFRDLTTGKPFVGPYYTNQFVSKFNLRFSINIDLAINVKTVFAYIPPYATLETAIAENAGNDLPPARDDEAGAAAEPLSEAAGLARQLGRGGIRSVRFGGVTGPTPGSGFGGPPPPGGGGGGMGARVAEPAMRMGGGGEDGNFAQMIAALEIMANSVSALTSTAQYAGTPWVGKAIQVADAAAGVLRFVSDASLSVMNIGQVLAEMDRSKAAQSGVATPREAAAETSANGRQIGVGDLEDPIWNSWDAAHRQPVDEGHTRGLLARLGGLRGLSSSSAASATAVGLSALSSSASEIAERSATQSERFAALRDLTQNLMDEYKSLVPESEGGLTDIMDLPDVPPSELDLPPPPPLFEIKRKNALRSIASKISGAGSGVSARAEAARIPQPSSAAESELIDFNVATSSRGSGSRASIANIGTAGGVVEDDDGATTDTTVTRGRVPRPGGKLIPLGRNRPLSESERFGFVRREVEDEMAPVRATLGNLSVISGGMAGVSLDEMYVEQQVAAEERILAEKRKAAGGEETSSDETMTYAGTVRFGGGIPSSDVAARTHTISSQYVGQSAEVGVQSGDAARSAVSIGTRGAAEELDKLVPFKIPPSQRRIRVKMPDGSMEYVSYTPQGPGYDIDPVMGGEFLLGSGSGGSAAERRRARDEFVLNLMGVTQLLPDALAAPYFSAEINPLGNPYSQEDISEILKLISSEYRGLTGKAARGKEINHMEIARRFKALKEQRNGNDGGAAAAAAGKKK